MIASKNYLNKNKNKNSENFILQKNSLKEKESNYFDKEKSISLKKLISEKIQNKITNKKIEIEIKLNKDKDKNENENENEEILKLISIKKEENKDEEKILIDKIYNNNNISNKNYNKKREKQNEEVKNEEEKDTNESKKISNVNVNPIQGNNLNLNIITNINTNPKNSKDSNAKLKIFNLNKIDIVLPNDSHNNINKKNESENENEIKEKNLINLDQINKKTEIKEINIPKEINNPDNKKQDINTINEIKITQKSFIKNHKEKLNNIIISNYGPELFDFSLELENENFFPDPLKNHKIENNIRTKMIDWMIEVLKATNSANQTFNLSVKIMDKYFAKCKKILVNSDVHIIGIVSMFIASKMEDIIPIRMYHIVNKISHGKFTEKDIIKKEKDILEVINFDIITNSTLDFIRFYIFDLINNNINEIEKMELIEHLNNFDHINVFLSKLILHSVEFNKYK
jgi:hypothetical protein